MIIIPFLVHLRIVIEVAAIACNACSRILYIERGEIESGNAMQGRGLYHLTDPRVCVCI